MVLRTRHLVGLFALFVIVLGIVFTLGYLLGRSRYEGQTQAAATAPAAEATRRATPPVVPAPSSSSESTAPSADQVPPSWDFYKSGEPAKAAELTFRKTLLLLDMQRQIIAHRRSDKRDDDLDAVDWRKFYESVKDFL